VPATTKSEILSRCMRGDSFKKAEWQLCSGKPSKIKGVSNRVSLLTSSASEYAPISNRLLLLDLTPKKRYGPLQDERFPEAVNPESSHFEHPILKRFSNGISQLMRDKFPKLVASLKAVDNKARKQILRKLVI
jgi:hypothetical protein